MSAEINVPHISLSSSSSVYHISTSTYSLTDDQKIIIPWFVKFGILASVDKTRSWQPKPYKEDDIVSLYCENDHETIIVSRDIESESQCRLCNCYYEWLSERSIEESKHDSGVDLKYPALDDKTRGMIRLGTHIQCGYDKDLNLIPEMRSCGLVKPIRMFLNQSRQCCKCSDSGVRIRIDIDSLVETQLKRKITELYRHVSFQPPEVVIRENRGLIRNEVNRLSELFAMLHPDRFEDECSWRTIGKLIYKMVDEDKKDGLYLWSQCLPTKSREEKRNKMEEIWTNSYWRSNQPITIKTLQYYAKCDSEALEDGKYDDWNRKRCMPILLKVLDKYRGDSHVTEAITVFFDMSYMSGHEKLWHFDGNILREDVKYSRLIDDIKTQFRPVYLELVDIVKALKAKAKTARELRECQEIIKKIRRNAARLYNISHWDEGELRHLTYRFSGEKIEERLNKNPNLLAVSNGVIECDDEYSYYRPGKPEDYLTDSIPTRYIPLDEKSESVRRLLGWLGKIFWMPGALYSHMMWCASLLCEGGYKRRFYYAAGPDHGTKAQVFHLLRLMFGPTYFVTLDSDFFIPRREYMSPVFLLLKRARIAYIPDMRSDQWFDANTLRQIHKGIPIMGMIEDKYYQISPDCHFVITQDEMTPADKWVGIEDERKEAIKEAPHLQWFTTKFCSDAKEQDTLHQYPIDEKWEEALPEMCEAMLSLMVHNYPELKKNRWGVPDVPDGKARMSMHWEELDKSRIVSDSQSDSQRHPI